MPQLTYIRLPNVYADDAFSRDLEIGVEVSRNSRFTVVRCNLAEAKELLSDARYYESEAPFMESYIRPIGRSASRAIPKILAAIESLEA